MPYADTGFETFGGDEDRTGEVSVGANQATAQAMQHETYNPLTQVLGYAVGGAVDLVDTVGSSLPGFSSATSWERGDLNNAALSFAGSPGLSKWYEQNKTGLEVTSGIEGVVASELLARRFAGPTSAFMGAMRKTPYLRRIALLDKQAEAAGAAVNALTKVGVQRGVTGTMLARTEAQMLTGKIVDGSFKAATVPVTRSSALWKSKGLSAAVGVRDAAATEAIMATTLNQNGFLYDDSMAYNLAFVGGGLAVGGAIQGFSAGYRARKFANSETIRRAAADALDPEGMGGARLGWMDKVKGAFKGLDAGDWLAGTKTDSITDRGVQINKLREAPISASMTDDPRALAENRNRLSIQLANQRTLELNQVTSKGISTDGQTRFNESSLPHWRHLSQMIDRDPAALMNAEMVGGLPQGAIARTVVDSHVARVEARLKETESIIDELTEKQSAVGLTVKQKEQFESAQSLAKRLRYEQELTPMASHDGEWMPLSEADSYNSWVEPEIIAKLTPREEAGASIRLSTKTDIPKGGVHLDSNLTFNFPGGKTFETADLNDVRRAYRLADDMMTRMANSKDPFQIKLPEKPSWIQLDMAEEIQRRNGNATIFYPGKMTRESAQVESMIQKAEGLKKLNVYDRKQIMAASKKGASYSANLSAARQRFNLPKLTSFERGITGTEESGVDALLRGMGEVSREELEQMTPQMLKEGVAQFRRVGDMVDATANDMKSLYGNSFTFMKGEDGTAIQPLLGFFRKFDNQTWTPDHVAERLANTKQRRLTVLTQNPEARLTKAIAESTTSSSDFQLVSRPDELVDTQIQGSLFGSMPGSGFGAASRAVKTSEHIARDSPALLGAIRLRDQVTRITGNMMKNDIKEAFGDTLKLLKNGRNDSSKLLLDQFHSLRSGWDLEATPIKQDDGFWGFRLGNTAENRERWFATYGKEMPVTDKGIGPMLQSYEGRPLVLDDLGLAVQQGFNKVSAQLVKEKNQLLSSMARNQINLQNHFVPSPDIQGKHIGFVQDPNGKTVQGWTIIEDTAEGFTQARIALEKKMGELPGGGMGYAFRTQDDIRNYSTIWEKSDMEMFDPNITAIQPGKKARGGLVGREVKTDAFENSLKYLQDSYMQHGNDTYQTLLREQIDAAKARSAISTNVVRDGAGRPDRFKSVHDYYLENLLGSNKLTTQGSFAGPTMKAVEKGLDKVLETAHVNGSKAFEALNLWYRDRMSTYTGRDTEAGSKQFAKLSAALGQHMPFESANEMMAREFAGVNPITTAKITAGVNQFSAAMMLRILEVGQPIMNMAGIVNAMPSVIRHFQPSAGEDAVAYAARIGHSANIFNLDGGRSIGIADMAKIGKRGLQRAMSKSSDKDWAFAASRGYVTQEVAELQRQFAAIDAPGPWKAFFVGDGSAGNSFKSKGVVGWSALLSDKSEDLSRSWGHMIGLEMADILKLEGDATRHTFAHDIANKMIANYNPANRPEVFQGALGAPLGLFQSFVQNYYQRLFRYVETKDARAFATQYATQSALFGMTGLAGYKEIMGTLGGRSDDGLDHPAGDFLSHGLLGQIPRLVGGDAVDFSSRGDTNVRIPGVGTQQLPGMAVASKLYEGVTGTLGLFWGDNPDLTATQVAEVLSNTLANRPISGMIEQFGAGGLDTDGYGQVVAETRGWMESSYRMLGLRSQRQAAELEAHYNDKNAQEHKAALDDKLRQSTRAAMRSGEFDNLPAYFEQYLENGGDAKHFKRWMKENYEAATTTVAERNLDRLLKNPAYFDRAQRLMDMGVSVDANETYSEDDLQAIMGQTKTLMDDYYAQQGQEGNMATQGDPESPYGF